MALHHVRKLLVLVAGVCFAQLGHPVGLKLFVRLFTVARHACLQLKHFHFALYLDPFVSSVGSSSRNSLASLSPRFPFSAHHSRNGLPLACWFAPRFFTMIVVRDAA